MYIPPEVLIAMIFLLLALGIVSGVRHIAKLRRGPVLVIKSAQNKAKSPAERKRENVWALFHDIQDQIPRLPDGEQRTATFIATFDEKLPDSVVASALQLIRDAGWNVTVSAPGRLSLVQARYGK